MKEENATELMSDNFIKITGNLACDFESYLLSGKQLSESIIEVYAGEGNPPNCVKVVAWGKLDPVLLANLTEGSRVTITGSLEPCETWISHKTRKAKASNVVKIESIAIISQADKVIAPSSSGWQGSATYLDSDGRVRQSDTIKQVKAEGSSVVVEFEEGALVSLSYNPPASEGDRA